ncbi:YueI family protein [Bacillus spongiae]|uniref:YueI family protein n=1 Tax=Bacillus spongiae TaxID=2683610 RepID=A0ABU8HDQ6_9BACI
MVKKSVDDYLQEGMYGKKELKPDERRRYLGTFRERVLVALTKSQVRKKGVYQEIEELMKSHPKAHLLLNGNMNYSYLSDYIKKANQFNLHYTMVTNKEYDCEYGLVLAYDYAINKKDILLSDNEDSPKASSPQKKPSLFHKLFKK